MTDWPAICWPVMSNRLRFCTCRTSSSAVEALSVLQQDKIDLLFLDIQMPQLNGLELSRMVGDRTRVVFTTAFEQYALEGFRVDALDYLLKPISYAEFLRAANKALRYFEQQQAVAPATDGVGMAHSIFVRTDYKMVQLHLDQILYVESLKDYVKIHTETAIRHDVDEHAIHRGESASDSLCSGFTVRLLSTWTRFGRSSAIESFSGRCTFRFRTPIESTSWRCCLAVR